MMKHYLKRKRFNLWHLLMACIIASYISTGTMKYRYAHMNETEPPIVETVPEIQYVEKIVEVEREQTPEEKAAQSEYAHALELLSRCVMSEAGNQPLEVKKLVVDVVLNRVEHPDFPDSISGVIYQRSSNGTWQFSVVGSGAINTAVPDDDCYQAIEEELQERSNEYVLYFDSAGYLPYGAPFAKVGGLYFSGN